jgi:hypothetical protein
MEAISLRHFRGGRVDALNASTPEVGAFCDAAWDQLIDNEERRRLFLAAVRSHAKLTSMVTWGRGWWRHTTMLEEVALRMNIKVPTLFSCQNYVRAKAPQKLYTTFLESAVQQMGQCWPERQVLSTCVRVDENRYGSSTFF